MSSSSTAKGQQCTVHFSSLNVDLSTLSSQQLLQVKKQLDDELEHLNSSFNQLRAAQIKFGECLGCLDGIALKGKRPSEGEGRILVPLTTSLYVPGTLVEGGTVIVDIGTGFYVEKSTADAKIFFTAKVKELNANLKDLEGILGGKSSNLRIVEDVLRQKMMQVQAGASPKATAA